MQVNCTDPSLLSVVCLLHYGLLDAAPDAAPLAAMPAPASLPTLGVNFCRVLERFAAASNPMSAFNYVGLMRHHGHPGLCDARA